MAHVLFAICAMFLQALPAGKGVDRRAHLWQEWPTYILNSRIGAP
jgi:hypothetical protein